MLKVCSVVIARAELLKYDTTCKDGNAQDCQLAGTVRGIPKKTTLFSGHYLRNRSTLDMGVLGYIGIF
jgi:hypothetical protein